MQARLKEQSTSLERANPRGGESNLLKGKIFDLEGNLYSPSYTIKDKKRYRYYVSQAVLQNESRPQGVITRLPARELEALIESTLVEKLKSGELLGHLNLVETDWEYQQMIGNLNNLNLRELLEPVLSQVVIQQKSLTLEVNLNRLAEQLEKAFAFDIKVTEELVKLEVPFVTGRAKSWALTIEPEAKAPQYAKGCFDMPEDDLQKWLQGIIWRDEHFSGEPIEQIAKRGLVSSTHVHKYINLSFTV